MPDLRTPIAEIREPLVTKICPHNGTIIPKPDPNSSPKGFRNVNSHLNHLESTDTPTKIPSLSLLIDPNNVSHYFSSSPISSVQWEIMDLHPKCGLMEIKLINISIPFILLQDQQWLIERPWFQRENSSPFPLQLEKEEKNSPIDLPQKTIHVPKGLPIERFWGEKTSQ